MTLRELEPFCYGFLNSKNENISMKIAEGLYALCKYLPLDIDPEIGLAGVDQSDFGALSQLGVFYDHGYGFWYKKENFDSKIEKYPEYAEEIAEYRDYFENLATALAFRKTWNETEENLRSNESYTAGGWVGHANPDFMMVANLGTIALREKVEKYKALNPENTIGMTRQF